MHSRASVRPSKQRCNPAVYVATKRQQLSTSLRAQHGKPVAAEKAEAGSQVWQPAARQRWARQTDLHLAAPTAAAIATATATATAAAAAAAWRPALLAATLVGFGAAVLMHRE